MPPCKNRRFRVAQQETLKLLDDVVESFGGKRSFGRARRLGNGVIEYPKRGFEPPPNIDGYERDKGNKWRFLPLWNPCVFRLQNMQIKPCGAVDVKSSCHCPEAPTFRAEVTFAQCEGCPFAKLVK